MNQLALDLSASRRDLGIERSAARAGEAWQRQARGYLLEWLSSPRPDWLTEEFREWATARGLDSPPDGRAFGKVMQSAKRERLVVAVGYAPACSSNGSAKVLWRAAHG